jgi:hypothetical protein
LLLPKDKAFQAFFENTKEEVAAFIRMRQHLIVPGTQRVADMKG